MRTHNQTRRGFLKAVGVATAALALPACARLSRRPPTKRPPNILLVVSDDQGYRDLGCFGSEEIKTANLDRLAAGGVRLTSFYVAWPACTPSRGAFLTGRYPQRNGTYDMFRNDKPDYGYKYPPEEYAVSAECILGMDTQEVLLPRVLQQAGYVSGIYGKWDLGMLRRFLPLQRGFDDFYGFVNTGIDYYTHERYGVPSMYRNNSPTAEDKGTYSTDLFRREAMRFIVQHKGQPFFCYAPFNAPHMASVLEEPKTVQAPEKYIRMYPEPQNAKAKQRVNYMAAVTCMDEAIGQILDLLEKRGLADDTIVIFFSDNGGSAGADNGPLRGGKSQLFEGGIRVPCIMRWPGVIPAGTVCDEFLTAIDIFPTLSKAAGLQPPKGVTLDGFDITGVLAGKTKSPRREMFWERRGDRAARVGNWKWVESARGTGLFDLSTDIGEQNDLSKEKPGILQMVKSRFAVWKKQMQETEPRGPFRNF